MSDVFESYENELRESEAEQIRQERMAYDALPQHEKDRINAERAARFDAEYEAWLAQEAEEEEEN